MLLGITPDIFRIFLLIFVQLCVWTNVHTIETSPSRIYNHASSGKEKKKKNMLKTCSRSKNLDGITKGGRDDWRCYFLFFKNKKGIGWKTSFHFSKWTRWGNMGSSIGSFELTIYAHRVDFCVLYTFCFDRNCMYTQRTSSSSIQQQHTVYRCDLNEMFWCVWISLLLAQQQGRYTLRVVDLYTAAVLEMSFGMSEFRAIVWRSFPCHILLMILSRSPTTVRRSQPHHMEREDRPDDRPKKI